MCLGCWEDEGCPRIDTPEVRALAALSKDVYPFGGFHIVVEDWNVEDSHIDYCLADESSTEFERAWGRRLRALPYGERVSVLALADGFWQPAP